MIINRLRLLYNLYFTSPVEYAKSLGVSVGDGCFFASHHHWSSEPYLVTIGNHVQLTGGVKIHTHGGCHAVRNKIPNFDTFGKVIIKDWVYIGSGAQIMPGVTVGEGSIVAAGSIVTKSIPPYTVYGGNPAKKICTIDEYLQNNHQYNLSVKGLSNEEKRRTLLSMPNEKFVTK